MFDYVFLCWHMIPVRERAVNLREDISMELGVGILGYGFMGGHTRMVW